MKTLGDIRKNFNLFNFLNNYSDSVKIQNFYLNDVITRFMFTVNDEIFVKVFLENEKRYFLDGSLAKECAVYNYIQSNKIPIHVPKMIYMGKSDEYVYIILEYIKGNGLRQLLYKGNPEEDEQIIRQISGQLTALHSICKNDKLNELCERNHESDIKYYTRLLKDVDNNYALMGEVYDIISKFLLVYRKKPVLIHGDASLGNWIVDKFGKVYLIDFETAFWGDYNYDIAVLTKQGHIVKDDFLNKGIYGHNIYLDAVRVYNMLFCVSVMAYDCPYYENHYGPGNIVNYSKYKDMLIECLHTYY